jgi:hypothetical protein
VTPSQGTGPGLAAGPGEGPAGDHAAAGAQAFVPDAAEAAARVLLAAGSPADADVIRACAALVITAAGDSPGSEGTRLWAGRVMFRVLLRRGVPAGMPAARAAADAVLDTLARARQAGEGPGGFPASPQGGR